MTNQEIQSLLDTITTLLRESKENVGNFEVTLSPEGEIRVEVWLEKPIAIDEDIKKGDWVNLIGTNASFQVTHVRHTSDGGIWYHGHSSDPFDCYRKEHLKRIAPPEKTDLEYFVENVNGRVPLASISYATNAPYFTIINSGLSNWISMQKTVRDMIAKANIRQIDAYADFHEDNHFFTFYPLNHNEKEKNLSPIIAYRLKD